MASIHSKPELSFIAEDGYHMGRIENDLVSVKMKDIDSFQSTPYGKLIDSGSPHLIIEVENPWEHAVIEEGRRLRHLFGEEGVNVNFISKTNSGLKIATYERGVEWETLACGTGVTASAYYSCLTDQLNGNQQISVEAKGGSLTVKLNMIDQAAQDVWLTGPARKVFSGFYDMVNAG